MTLLAVVQIHSTGGCQTRFVTEVCRKTHRNGFSAIFLAIMRGNWSLNDVAVGLFAADETAGEDRCTAAKRVALVACKLAE